MNEFTVWQSHLPGRLGISIEEIRARRDALLEEGVDWHKNGQRILFTAAAEEKLRASLHVALSPSNATAPANDVLPADLPQTALPEKNAPATPTLIVWRSAPKIKNRRIVEVHAEGTPDPETPSGAWLLWVRDNSKFRPGMRIPPEALEARAPGQFNYVAVRAPR